MNVCHFHAFSGFSTSGSQKVIPILLVLVTHGKFYLEELIRKLFTVKPRAKLDNSKWYLMLYQRGGCETGSGITIGLFQVKEDGWTWFSKGWQGCSEGFPEGEARGKS